MNSQYELNLYKGASFAQMLTLYNPDGTIMDLTDGTVEAQIREYPEAYDAVDFDVSHNGSGGQIFLSLTSGQTSAISYSRGVYDVFLELNGSRIKVLMGEVNIVSDVTRYPWLGMGQYLRVLALPSRADFPLTGDIKTLYVSAEENALYRWAGDGYAILNCITIKGEKGDKGDKGDTGDRGAPGEDGLPGPAGEDGANGVGIESIAKTSTSGLVDTYTITKTDGTTSTFTVTNGTGGASAWGELSGNIADQTDLITALGEKASLFHTHGGIEVRPDYTISTTDLTAGTSALASGTVYFVYEA